MNDVVKRTWTALDGGLAFDIAINRDGVPSTATIRCESEQRFLAISESRLPFDFKFPSGCYVHGMLQLRRHIRIDGVDSIGVFAEIGFRIDGQHPDTHFEGLMVGCPTSAA